MDIRFGNTLDLDRCPHCSIAKPLIRVVHEFQTQDADNRHQRVWKIYVCSKCGGAVLTHAEHGTPHCVGAMYPAGATVSDALPERARNYLKQATESLHAPAGAVMLTASAVDAMLKDKKYADGSLYARIEAAAKDHLITPEMATWAHQVRLEANDQRHADAEAQMPTELDAKRCIHFARALGQFLFELPRMVASGIAESKTTPEAQKK